MQDGLIESGEFGLALRQSRFRMKGADHVRHSLRGSERRLSFLRNSLEVEKDLAVRVERTQLLGELQSQGSLADAAHTPDAGNCGAPGFDGLSQPGKLGYAAGE